MMVTQNQAQLGSNPKAKHIKYFKIQVFWLSMLTDRSESLTPAPPLLSIVLFRLQRTTEELMGMDSIRLCLICVNFCLEEAVFFGSF